MLRLPAAPPVATHCHGFHAPVRFQDVEAEVLAREAAVERALPAELARGLLEGGALPRQARARVIAMRRRAIEAGDVQRVRFWADVLAALDREG